MAFALPATIRVKEIRHEGVQIYYPEVRQLKDRNVQRRINQEIVKRVGRLIDEQYKKQAADRFTEMIGTFEIKTNERNIFSVTLGSYAYAEGFAHGLTLMDSITLDIETGKVYDLQDLFKVNSDYVKVLSKDIQAQIKERELPILNGFTSIAKDQSYYLADKSLVIYFQAYDMTPGYVGLPAFPMNAFLFEDILKEKGPLKRLLPTV